AFERLFWKQGRMDAAVDDGGATLFRYVSNLVTAQGIAGIHTDADDVTCLNCVRVKLLEALVNQDGISERSGSGCCKHEQPARCDDGGSERIVIKVHQMYSHRVKRSPS